MTHETITAELERRGWVAQDHRSRRGNARGINISATRGDKTLSVQAGEYLYSRPRALAADYEEVEAAAWTTASGAWLVMEGQDDDVLAYADELALWRFVDFVEAAQ